MELFLEAWPGPSGRQKKLWSMWRVWSHEARRGSLLRTAKLPHCPKRIHRLQPTVSFEVPVPRYRTAGVAPILGLESPNEDLQRRVPSRMFCSRTTVVCVYRWKIYRFAPSQTGLHYATSVFDKERLQRDSEIAHGQIAELACEQGD
jgi:hypothetical protein